MTPQTPRPAPIATTNVCKIVTALPKNPIFFSEQTLFSWSVSVFLSFPYYSDLFFTCFIYKVILFLSSLSSPFHLTVRTFSWKKRKKIEHIDGFLHALTLFILFHSLPHPPPLHLLHTPQIPCPAKIPAYAPDIFPHQMHSLDPHPPILYISYVL